MTKGMKNVAMMSPKYKHDCDGCHFLGRFSDFKIGDVVDYDLYVCPNLESPMLTSLIARYGSEGSHYSSSPVGVLLQFSNEQLSKVNREVWARALEKRFVLSRERLMEMRDSPMVYTSHVEASRIIEGVQSIQSADFLSKGGVKSALQYVDIHMRGTEPHEEELIAAVKKYLQVIIDEKE